MKRSGIDSTNAEVFLGRRYLAKGFLDDALRMFLQHAESLAAEDWTTLRDRLLERGRIADVINVCQAGRIPIPRDELLRAGDEYLRRGDVDRAIHFYEVAEADECRWRQVVDRLVEVPARYQQARGIVARHLTPARREPVTARVVNLAK